MSQVVVGGSIAAFVAADQLANEGVDVELFLPTRCVGGGFAAHEIGDHRVELGSRLLDLPLDREANESQTDLVAGDPGSAGFRQFLPMAEAYVRELAGEDLRPVSVALTDAGEVRVRDWMVDGNLSGILELIDRDRVLRERIRCEVAANLDESCRRGFGARGLFANPHGLAGASLLSASRAHTGRTFHERFVEPFAARIVDGGSAGVAADLHRKIWMPLFWPGTLASALAEGQLEEPFHPSYTLRNGGLALLVERLIARVTAHPLVAVRRHGALAHIESERGASLLQMADGARVHARLPILGVNPAELFEAVGSAYSPHRMTSTMCWVEVAGGSVPDTLWLLDADRPVFRVSRNQADDGPTVVCCEVAWWVRAQEIEASATAELVRAGIIEHTDQASVLTIARIEGVDAPSPQNRRRFQASQEHLGRLNLDVIVAGASEFGADSLTEQVAQGLFSVGMAMAGSTHTGQLLAPLSR